MRDRRGEDVGNSDIALDDDHLGLFGVCEWGRTVSSLDRVIDGNPAGQVLLVFFLVQADPEVMSEDDFSLFARQGRDGAMMMSRSRVEVDRDGVLMTCSSEGEGCRDGQRGDHGSEGSDEPHRWSIRV